jgi:adenylate cyclase
LLRPAVSATSVAPAALLATLHSAVAAADPATWTVWWENPRFHEWFPPAGAGLDARLPGFNEARARERLARGRPYRIEIEIAVQPRAFTAQLELRSTDIAGRPAVIIEAHNITKQKEAEYMLDSYSRLMERQARELAQQKEQAERLLLNIMPPRVAAELRDFGTTTPQSIRSASVLMLDFVGFTDMAIARDPGALIAELNDVFTSFDRIVVHSRCERIKTIGDAYMAVSGMPEPDPDHEFNIARAALRMRRFIERRNGTAVNRWRCRIGIASGAMIGSIVGVQKYIYDIFGAPVNLAARLQALAAPMQILATAELATRIRDDFVLRPVGPTDIKGFGVQEVWRLEDEARPQRP